MKPAAILLALALGACASHPRIPAGPPTMAPPQANDYCAEHPKDDLCKTIP